MINNFSSIRATVRFAGSASFNLFTQIVLSSSMVSKSPLFGVMLLSFFVCIPINCIISLYFCSQFITSTLLILMSLLIVIYHQPLFSKQSNNHLWFSLSYIANLDKDQFSELELKVIIFQFVLDRNFEYGAYHIQLSSVFNQAIWWTFSSSTQSHLFSFSFFVRSSTGIYSLSSTISLFTSSVVIVLSRTCLLHQTNKTPDRIIVIKNQILFIVV